MDSKAVLLVAWLETEGSITIEVRHNVVYLIFQIPQKEKEPLEKLRKLLGFGEITKAGSNYLLRFRNKKDIENIFRLLESVPKEFWLTHKYEKYLKAKEFWKWKSERPKRERYSKKEVEFLNIVLSVISPQSKKKIKYKNPKCPSRELLEEIFELRQQGKTFEEISQITRIPKTTVFRYFRRFKDRRYINV